MPLAFQMADDVCRILGGDLDADKPSALPADIQRDRGEKRAGALDPIEGAPVIAEKDFHHCLGTSFASFCISPHSYASRQYEQSASFGLRPHRVFGSSIDATPRI
ncbi:MAG: hypothetical protein Q8R70_04940 [Methanoregula sp.]|nr:hypothetical protein [Methanoregula sp.]